MPFTQSISTAQSNQRISPVIPPPATSMNANNGAWSENYENGARVKTSLCYVIFGWSLFISDSYLPYLLNQGKMYGKQN